MKCEKTTMTQNSRGFTLIELLVVIAIIIALAAMLIPALGKAFATAKSMEDRTRLEGIHGAMLLDATGNEGRLPRPSVLASQYDPDQLDHLNPTTDTTGNLMSLLIARNYFTTDFLISPVETNSSIRDINEFDLVYDYDGIDGETILWDEAFNGDVSTATAANPAHNSYAHQAICGQRIRLKWNSDSSSSDIVLSNRGPELVIDMAGNQQYQYGGNTLAFHGEDSMWKGNIVCGDGSTRLAESFFPEGIAYQPLNGTPLGPDNIFLADWVDIPLPSVPEGMSSGDNWMVICTEIIEHPELEDTNEIIAVWD
jgi:prepilin-type N-terminal cleavage/methylation domain-containing protein